MAPKKLTRTSPFVLKPISSFIPKPTLGEKREQLRQKVLDGPMTKDACLRSEACTEVWVWVQVGHMLNAKTHANQNCLPTAKLTEMKENAQYSPMDDVEMCELRDRLRRNMLDGLKYGVRWEWPFAWEICKDIQQRKQICRVETLEAMCEQMCGVGALKDP